MFFIHGGSFVYGAGSDYDGTWLAANNDVIVVTSKPAPPLPRAVACPSPDRPAGEPPPLLSHKPCDSVHVTKPQSPPPPPPPPLLQGYTAGLTLPPPHFPLFIGETNATKFSPTEPTAPAPARPCPTALARRPPPVATTVTWLCTHTAADAAVTSY